MFGTPLLASAALDPPDAPRACNYLSPAPVTGNENGKPIPNPRKRRATENSFDGLRSPMAPSAQQNIQPEWSKIKTHIRKISLPRFKTTGSDQTGNSWVKSTRLLTRALWLWPRRGDRPIGLRELRIGVRCGYSREQKRRNPEWYTK